MYYVYLLQSTVDDKYYIGQTSNISKRLLEHNSGNEKSTKHRKPFKLLGYEIYKTRNEAMWRERELKKSAYKRKKFINKFFRGGENKGP